MAKTVTMKMIADKLGISKSTVSYALSGKKKLSQILVDSIVKTAQELGYNPNQIAPLLKKEHRESIALLLPNSEFSSYYENELFHQEFLRGCLKAITSSKFYLSIFNYPPPLEDEELFYQKLSEAFGIISLSPDISQAIKTRAAIDAPMVRIGSEIGEMDFVIDADGVGAGYQIASHGIDKGLTNVLFLQGTQDSAWQQQVRTGFDLAFTKHKLEWQEQHILIPTEVKGFKSCIETIKNLLPFPQVIISPSPTMTHMVRFELFQSIQRGVLEPKFISIRGYSKNSWYGKDQLMILYPAYELGGKAIEMILAITAKKIVSHNSIILPCTIMGEL